MPYTRWGRLFLAFIMPVAGTMGCAPRSEAPGDGAGARTADSTTTPVLRAPDVIFVGTPTNIVRQMLALVDVGTGDTLFDLGSGDGRIVIDAARRGAYGVGIEINPTLIEDSWRNAEEAGVRDRVDFRLADLFETDLRSASAVTLYLLPDLNVKLRPKLFAELRPGTPVVSHNFPMAGWIPDSTIQARGTQLFLWYIPADVAGDWAMAIEGSAPQAWELRLAQEFQAVSGVVRVNGREQRMSRARLRGTRLSFEVSDSSGAQVITSRVDGTVRGDTFTGTITRPGQRGATRFTAMRPARPVGADSAR